MTEKIAEKSPRGGQRPGAGRPRTGVVRLNITLPTEQVEWLKSQGNISEQIRDLVAARIEEK